MSSSLSRQVKAALAEFASASRLYELQVDGIDAGSVLVEAFAADDALDTVGTRDVIVLSTSIHLDLASSIGAPAAFDISLADRNRTRFAGDIDEVEMLGSDGGLTRYRLRIASWLWRLAHVRNCRVWQDKTVREIVDAVFAAYQPMASWRWSAEVSSCMDRVPPRSYCCQYRESDLAFVQRLLIDEGLCWRMEQADDGPCVLLFADSRRVSAVPDDASSAESGGIRYHGARASEHRNTVQALSLERRLHAALVTLLSSNYKGKQVLAASSPTLAKLVRHLPLLESFDVPGQYAFANSALARHYADLQMEAQEARGQLWRGRSTVRTLRAGTRMTVTGAPVKALPSALAVLRVVSVGVNNLPTSAQQALASLFGPVHALLWAHLPALEEAALLLTQARETGYANYFEACSADVPWRPLTPEHDAGGLPVKPTASGSQTAIVIGPDGGGEPDGANEIHCDRLGRVRIRFHWQDDAASCWVRVAQRAAGGGMGSQFLPRIGQEVLVQFLEGDIDRPVIVGAMYNGRGEGGAPQTPGGALLADSDAACFTHSHDHLRAGQGNYAGGNSPVWHGAASGHDGHRNGAAQWGLRSKEFGGFGYNQLLFDDTDARGRVQLKCTQAASELNLGHLIHTSDNYRGSFRGLGAELRTDVYGAVRAGAGLLVSSYAIEHNSHLRAIRRATTRRASACWRRSARWPPRCMGLP